MAQQRQTLGQSKPAATTLTALYTVPAGKQATVSSVTCCNQSTSNDTLRISVAVAGAADATKQYLFYDLPIPANDTFTLTIGITLAATDILRCYSGSGNVSFNAFGIEVS